MEGKRKVSSYKMDAIKWTDQNGRDANKMEGKRKRDTNKMELFYQLGVVTSGLYISTSTLQEQARQIHGAYHEPDTQPRLAYKLKSLRRFFFRFSTQSPTVAITDKNPDCADLPELGARDLELTRLGTCEDERRNAAK